MKRDREERGERENEVKRRESLRRGKRGGFVCGETALFSIERLLSYVLTLLVLVRL